MAEFPALQFTRNWENPTDFPTVETSEAKVRADLQALHDETKDYINQNLSHYLTVMPASAEVEAELDALDGRVAALEAGGGGGGGADPRVPGLLTRMSAAESDITDLEGEVAGLKYTDTTFNTRITALENGGGGGGDSGLASRVTALETTSSGLVEKTSELEQTADGLTSRVSSVETDATGTRSRVSTLEQTANGITTRVEDVEDTVDGYSSRISSVEQTASGLTSRVSAVEQTASGLTGSVNTLEQTAEETASTITNLDGRVSQIRQTVDNISFTVSSPTSEGYVTMALTVGGNTYRGVVKIDGNVDISGDLSAEALYANHGDIADLTVERLRTSRRIPKYLARDTSDDNYIKIEGQVIQFISGVCAGTTEQAADPTGALLYWEQDISGATLGSDGYPYVNGARVFTTAQVTSYPVTVYTYNELVKRQIAFRDEGSGTYVPYDIFGAGDGAGHNQGILVKTADSFGLSYTTTANKTIGVQMGNDGYVDITGLRRTTALDLSGLSESGGTVTERVEGDSTVYSYSVAVTESAITISYGGGNSLVVTL